MIDKDLLLKWISLIVLILSLIPLFYWYYYDYEKGEGSFLLIFVLMTFVNYVIQTNRIWRLEDKEIKLIVKGN